MAEARFLPRGFQPNIGQSIARGFGLAAQQQQSRRLQEQFEFQKQQATFAQEQMLEQRKQTRLANELGRNEKLLLNPDIKKNPDLVRKLINRNNAITSEQAPGSVNIDPELVIQNMDSFTDKLKALSALEEGLSKESPQFQEFFDEMLIEFSESPERLKAIERLGAPTAQEAFGEKERQAKIKAERQLGEKEAELKLAQKLTGQQQEEVRIQQADRIRKALKGRVPDEELEGIVLESIGDITPTGLKAVLPEDEDANTTNLITFIKTANSELERITDDLVPVIAGADRVRLEQQRNLAMQQLADKLGLKPPEAPAGEKIPEPPTIDTKENLSYEEYVTEIRKNPANLIGGKLRNTPEELRQDYLELLQEGRLKRKKEKKKEAATGKEVKKPKRTLFGLAGEGESVFGTSPEELEELGTPFKKIPREL